MGVTATTTKIDHRTILYYTILYYTLLYYTILYYTILYVMISYFGACRHQYIMVQGMPLFGPQVACCDLGTPAVCVWQIFRVWHVAWQVLFDQQSPRDRDCNCKKDKKRNTTPMLPNTSELVGCPILPGRSCPKMSQVAIDSPSTTW